MFGFTWVGRLGKLSAELSLICKVTLGATAENRLFIFFCQFGHFQLQWLLLKLRSSQTGQRNSNCKKTELISCKNDFVFSLFFVDIWLISAFKVSFFLHLPLTDVKEFNKWKIDSCKIQFGQLGIYLWGPVHCAGPVSWSTQRLYNYKCYDKEQNKISKNQAPPLHTPQKEKWPNWFALCIAL